MDKINISNGGKRGLNLKGNFMKIEIGQKKQKSIIKDKKSSNIVKIKSFTKKGIYYEVDKKKKTCSCPAFQYRLQNQGFLCKHLIKVLNFNPNINGKKQKLSKKSS